MSREIKFRAWGKAQNRWINLNGFSIEFTGCLNPGLVFSITEQGVLYEISANDVELMQYTGLKDKNGKEIYEGDIVNMEGFVHRKFSVVFYPTGRFCLKGSDGGHNDYIPFGICEVIGNIYEHSELLKHNKEPK